MIEYILELSAELDHAIQHEHPSIAFHVAKPLADELDRFDVSEFVPEVRADLARIRVDVRRMCTNIAAMHYKEIWAEDYPRLHRLVKGYVGKSGQGVPVAGRPPSGVTTAAGQKEIFVSYAHEDEAVVAALVRFLQSAGYSTWFDKDDLLGGEEWETVIPKAIATSQLVMLVFSSHSVNKRGFVQKELRLALDEASKIPANRVYIMPVRLDLCERPDPVIRYHVLDLFGERDFSKLLESVKNALNKEYRTAETVVANALKTQLSVIQAALRSTLTAPLVGINVPSVRIQELSPTEQGLLEEIRNDTRSSVKGLMIAMFTPARGMYVPYLWDNQEHGAIQLPLGDMTMVQMAIKKLVALGFLNEYHKTENGTWYTLNDQ